MLLGRRLMAAPVAAAEPVVVAKKTRQTKTKTKAKAKAKAKAKVETETETETEVTTDAQAVTEISARLLRAAEADDRFFCDVMETIPAQFYFPTDEEENWRRSAPKKYHKDVLAAKAQASTKHALKRAKFTPSAQKSNEQLQQDAAAEERKQKQARAASEAGAPSVAPVKAKTDAPAGLDGLRQRLAVKIEAMREQRRADEKQGKKRQRANANANASAPAAKRSRKGGDKKAAAAAVSTAATTTSASVAKATSETTMADATDATAISYGSLLLSDEHKKQAPERKTRNGQGMRGIKNLLKKAERNQQRLEELKKTDEGRAVVQQKGWDKAMKQAAGEVVLDDPKLLRNKLKKKEKQRAKSSKEWKQRTTQLEMKRKEKQRQRGAKGKAGGAKKGPRAGFEGKKGEAFLNGDKKKPKGAK